MQKILRNLKPKNILKKLNNVYDSISEWMVENKDLSYLIFICFFVRAFFISVTDNYLYGGDIFVRNAMSYWISHEFQFFPSPDWQPLHFYLLTLLMWLTGEPEVSVRLLGLFCGTGATFYVFRIAEKLFNKFAAKVSTLIYVSYFYFVINSSVTFSETTFFFFVFSGIYYLMLYFDEQKIKHLTWAAILLACSSWIRSEGWPINFIFGIAILFKYWRNWKHVLTYGLITGIPLVIFMANNYIYQGDPLYFLNYSDLEVINTFEKFSLNVIEFLPRVKVAFPFWIFIIGLFANFVLIFKQARYRIVFVNLLIITLIAFYKLVTGTLLFEPRYFVFYSVWFVITFWGAFFFWCDEQKVKKIGIIYFFIVLFGQFGAINYFRVHLIDALGYQFTYNPDQKKLFTYLKEEIKPEDKLFTDTAWHDFHWTLEYMGRLHPYQIRCRVPTRFWMGETFTLEQFHKCVNEDRTNVLILFPVRENHGKMHEYLQSPEGVSELEKIGYHIAFESNGYKVLRLDIK